MNETKLRVHCDQHMWGNVVQMLEECGMEVLVGTAWKCSWFLQRPINSVGLHTMSARFYWASIDPHKSGFNSPGQWWLSTEWEPLTTTDIRLFMTNRESIVNPRVNWPWTERAFPTPLPNARVIHVRKKGVWTSRWFLYPFPLYSKFSPS